MTFSTTDGTTTRQDNPVSYARNVATLPPPGRDRHGLRPRAGGRDGERLGIAHWPSRVVELLGEHGCQATCSLLVAGGNMAKIACNAGGRQAFCVQIANGHRWQCRPRCEGSQELAVGPDWRLRGPAPDCHTRLSFGPRGPVLDDCVNGREGISRRRQWRHGWNLKSGMSHA